MSKKDEIRELQASVAFLQTRIELAERYVELLLLKQVEIKIGEKVNIKVLSKENEILTENIVRFEAFEMQKHCGTGRLDNGFISVDLKGVTDE